jgi:hypothetical protein
MRRLPVLPESLLDDIEIATPCSADWNAMPGDERVRHCPDCRLNVYNVAAMSRREAGLLIQQREGRLCLRLFRRSDGTIITADCWDKLRAARRRGRLAFACALVLVCLLHLGIRVAAVRAMLAHVAGETPPAVAVSGGITPQRPVLPIAPPPAPLRGIGMGHATMGGPKMPPHRMGKAKINSKVLQNDELIGGIE